MKITPAEDCEYRGDLLTEKSNPLSVDLDRLETSELVSIFNEEDLVPQKAVAQARAEIARAIDLIADKLLNGGRLFYLGAGTSGRLAVLDAAECPPTFCTKPDLVQGVIAGGDQSLIKSSEGLEDNIYLAIDDLNSRNFNKNDCLIGITAGGTTPYVRSALSHSVNLGALSIAICCVPTSQVEIICDVDIRLLTGPEILTGSTRLKAGTATKMTLNIISTSVMVKLGKVYSNKMIDVAVTNKKLLDRALRILDDILHIDRNDALQLLRHSQGSVKHAILMGLGNVNYSTAEHNLQISKGNLRKSLSAITQKRPAD